MSILKRLLVPVDGSNGSNAAVDYALQLARSEGAALTFCYAVDLPGTIAMCSTPFGVTDAGPAIEALEASSKAFLSAAATKAAEAGVRALAIELAGPAVGSIGCAVADLDVSAIVMGTSGRHGVDGLFLGSTTDGVLRRTDVPVFVISHPNAAKSSLAPIARILVALDDSEPADAALEFALALAQGDGASIVFAAVVDVGALLSLAASAGLAAGESIAEERATAQTLLDGALARTRELGVPAETVLVEGEPVEQLLELVRSQKIDLVVIGTHGRRGLRRLVMGSVAERVVRVAPVPVAVVRRHVTYATDANASVHALPPKLVPA